MRAQSVPSLSIGFEGQSIAGKMRTRGFVLGPTAILGTGSCAGLMTNSYEVRQYAAPSAASRRASEINADLIDYSGFARNNLVDQPRRTLHIGLRQGAHKS